MPLPKAILDKPDLHPGLEFYYKGFWDLMADRMTGMNGSSMIRYTAMSVWMNDHDLLDGDERDRFKIIITNIDMVYLEYVRSKEKK